MRRVALRAFLFGSVLVLLTSCSPLQEAIQAFGPTATPMPTPTARPHTGVVGERLEWDGWAITVSNVLRSTINPTERIPENAIPDDKDYIGMDVIVERTADRRGYVRGEQFSLVDGSGMVYSQDHFIKNWVYHSGAYSQGDMGSERVVIPVDETARDLVLSFQPDPIQEPLEVALNQLSKPIQIDLREAIERGILSAGVRGVSLESIEVEVEVSLEVEESYELSISPGTLFLAPSADLQTMVVRRELIVFLEPKDEISLDIQVACANMTLSAPQGGETYRVQIEPPAEELRKLLGLPEVRNAPFRLQQFAVWTITDNPPPGGYVGLGSGGGGSPPSRQELDQIRAWFEQAGLAVNEYAGLR